MQEGRIKQKTEGGYGASLCGHHPLCIEMGQLGCPPNQIINKYYSQVVAGMAPLPVIISCGFLLYAYVAVEFTVLVLLIFALPLFMLCVLVLIIGDFQHVVQLTNNVTYNIVLEFLRKKKEDARGQNKN